MPEVPSNGVGSHLYDAFKTSAVKGAKRNARRDAAGIRGLRDNRASCILELLESRRRLVRGCVVVEDVKSWLHERYR